MSKKKKKYYVVWVGVKPGIYESWADCLLHTKGYPGARYKSFPSRAEAEAAFAGTGGMPKRPSAKRSAARPASPKPRASIIRDSISVDAACSGNPGRMEYRGVFTDTGEEIFRQGPYRNGTNNIGEFLALVHGVALLQRQGLHDKVIYSDSKIAMGWMKKKTCRTSVDLSRKNPELGELVKRAEKWLRENTFKNPILKWETRQWGEIPADFGRK